MFIDYSQRQENSLFDLSLSLSFKKFIKSLTSQNKEETNMDVTISFFKLIIDFCNKEFSELNNEFSGADAFSIFTSALNNLNVEVETTEDVLDKAYKYYGYLLSFKDNGTLDSEKMEDLIVLLDQINEQLNLKLENNRMNSWEC